MSWLDNLRALFKLRITSVNSTVTPGPQIAATPGLGQLEVVNTNLPPSSRSVPGSWSRSFLGPGQPFSSMDNQLGNDARSRDKELEPRTFQYITGINTTIMPRLAYGLTSFFDLRFYAESVPEVAMCIRLLTEEMKAFVPTIVDDSEKAVPDDQNPYRWMTERPDRYNPWPVWLSRFLYNVLVYDAGCAYLKRTSQGKITATRIIDGSTIFVIIDEAGEQPSPPAPAFQQIIWGVPRMFLNTKQLWYKPRHLRADAPYGRSPIEDCMPAVKLLLNLWDYEGQKYIVGNIPELLISVPPNFGGDDADAILEYEDGFNARMTGANAERVRARFVASGMEVLQTKELTFNKDSYDAATNAVRMSYGILQSEVGEGPSGGLGGKGYAEAMQSAFYRMGLAPLIAYVESHFNDIIKFNNDKNIKFKLEFPAESLDPSKEEEKYTGRFTSGLITRDEGRQGIGEKPLGGDEGKFIMTPGQGGGEDDGEGDPDDQGIGVKQQPSIRVKSSHHPLKVVRPLNVEDVKHLRVVGDRVRVRKLEGEVVTEDDLRQIGQEEFDRLATTYGINWDQVDQLQFLMGMQEEQEHLDTVGGDEETIVHIVLDHLTEDPKYYTKLQSVMKLQKASGVDAGDDLYFGCAVEQRADVNMPHQGANDSDIVALKGPGLEARAALWKPETGEKEDLQNWVGGKLFVRGAAAYLLDRELAPFDDRYLVPVTYDASIDGVNGSVQHYVEGRKAAENVSDYADYWVEQGAVLDYIMGQVDRDHKNYLTHPHDDKRPIFIDNDLSFPVKADQHLHSSFIDAWRGKLLSDTTMDSIYLLIGNHDLWADLLDVLDCPEAVNNAKARAKKLHELGMIPPNDDHEAVAVSDDMVQVDLEKADFEEGKHPRAKDGKFAPKGGGSGDEAVDEGQAEGKESSKADEGATLGDFIDDPEDQAADAVWNLQHPDTEPKDEWKGLENADPAVVAYIQDKFELSHPGAGKEAWEAYDEGNKLPMIEYATAQLKDKGEVYSSPTKDPTPTASYPNLTTAQVAKVTAGHYADAATAIADWAVDKGVDEKEANNFLAVYLDRQGYEPESAFENFCRNIGSSRQNSDPQKFTADLSDLQATAKASLSDRLSAANDQPQADATNPMADLQFKSKELAPFRYKAWNKNVEELAERGTMYFINSIKGSEAWQQAVESAHRTFDGTPQSSKNLLADFNALSGTYPNSGYRDDIVHAGLQGSIDSTLESITAEEQKYAEKGDRPNNATAFAEHYGSGVDRVKRIFHEADSGVDWTNTDNVDPDKVTKIVTKSQSANSLLGRYIDIHSSQVNQYDTSSVENLKHSIITNLSDTTGDSYDDVNDNVASWANTSNDHSLRSLGIQAAVAKEFGSKLSAWQKQSIKDIGPTKIKSSLVDYKNFVHGVYDNTQRSLSEMGFKPEDEITVYRGMQTLQNAKMGDILNYHGNAAESWSFDKTVADGFGDQTYMTKVKVKDIYSTAYTGVGCKNESELVVMNNERPVMMVNRRKYIGAA